MCNIFKISAKSACISVPLELLSYTIVPYGVWTRLFMLLALKTGT